MVGLGVQAGLVQRVELAVEVDRAVGVPEQPDHPQGFLEAADGTGEIEAVGHGVFAFAAAQAEDEATLGQVVEGQCGLREQGGMAAHGVDHGADQRHPLGQHCRRGRDREPVQVPVRRGEAVARSVNSGAQIESGQKLTMWSGSQTEW